MNDRREWLPRTTREKLIRVDTVLAGVVPRFTDTRERISALLPGHSGRPAGNGEPPGGSGGGGATVVERTVLGADLPDEVADDDPAAGHLPSSPERAALAELERLADRIVSRVETIAARAGCDLAGAHVSGAVRRLVWARWAVRVLEQMNPRIPDRVIDRLWFDAEALAGVCDQWGPARQIASRGDDLAVDDSEQWCRSHLRIGARVHRSPRYPAGGVCRACGDFAAEQGFMPTLEILDAMQSGVHGSTIAKLIRAEHESRRARKTRRRRR